jgi:hypothetical protein
LSQPLDRMTLLMLVFDDDPQAHAALQELKALNREKRIKIKAAAVVSKNTDGKIKVKPKVLALIEPLWIQDFIQALIQSSLSPAPRQITIGHDLGLETPPPPPLYAEPLRADLPPVGRDEYEATMTTGTAGD